MPRMRGKIGKIIRFVKIEALTTLVVIFIIVCAVNAQMTGAETGVANELPGNGPEALTAIDLNDINHFFDINKIETDPLKQGLQFHGYLKVGWPAHGHNDDAEDESTNVFDQTELIFWIGADIFENLALVSELELEDGFSEIEFETIELNWTILPDLATLKIGKFIYPFGIERFVEDSPSNKLATRPLPSRRIIPGTYSDNGLQLFGELPVFSKSGLKYEVALTTGLAGVGGDGEQDFEENNDSKTVGGRLGFRFFPGFEVGASYSTGEYDDDERLRLDFVGLDLAFKKAGFEFRAEYIRGNVEAEKDKSSYNREGYYGQISYKYNTNFNYFSFIEGTARLDSVDPNDIETNESDSNRISFGVKTSPINHLLLKLEYTFENEAKESREKNLLLQTIFMW